MNKVQNYWNFLFSDSSFFFVSRVTLKLKENQLSISSIQTQMCLSYKSSIFFSYKHYSTEHPKNYLQSPISAVCILLIEMAFSLNS